MSTLQSAIEKLVQTFVGQVRELAADAVIAGLKNTAQFHTRAGQSVARPAPGAKRSPAELEHLTKTFLAFVKKHPGLRIEQINKQLGTKTKDLALPIRKAVADGALKTKGEKRSTTYYAAAH